MSFPSKAPRVKDAASSHQCPECDRAYERPDHLARHLDSRVLQYTSFLWTKLTGNKIVMSEPFNVRPVIAASTVGTLLFQPQKESD
jgi:hypothetical protein